MAWKPTDVEKLVTNPFYAIQIEPTLCVPHEPIVSRDTWIAANVKAIKEIGAERWLNRLLDTLEGR